MLHTLETLFGAFEGSATLRSELPRLFGWLRERGVIAIVTGERGDGTLTRFGIEEYVSDCVIVLDHRVSEQTSTRRLRVLKYRGSLHGTKRVRVPDRSYRVSVLPITSLGLQHAASQERLSTGVPSLDATLDGAGLFRGTSMTKEFVQLAEAFDYSLEDFRWFTVNAMKSAFIAFDERLALIDDVIKPGYAALTE